MSRKNVCMMEKRIICITATLIFVLLAAWGINVLMKPSSTKASAENYKYYTSIQVKQGDSLWSIAGNYISADYTDMNDYIDEIKDLNHLNSDAIHAGEYLLVPYYSSQYL